MDDKIINELADGFTLLIYDIPYPSSKNGDRKWYSWYDWATRRLKALGYSIQYSVIVINEARISEVEKIRNKIEEKRKKLNDKFNLDIPPANIKIIKFSPKTIEDAKTLLSLLVEGLKQTLQAFRDEMEKRLLEEKDRSKIDERIRHFIKKITKKDFLNLLNKDKELNDLLLQLEILTA